MAAEMNNRFLAISEIDVDELRRLPAEKQNRAGEQTPPESAPDRRELGPAFRRLFAAAAEVIEVVFEAAKFFNTVPRDIEHRTSNIELRIAGHAAVTSLSSVRGSGFEVRLHNHFTLQ